MSDSDCDWFDKDDDDLMKDVEKTLKKNQSDNTEYIQGPATTLDEYIKEITIKAAGQSKNLTTKGKVNVGELRKISQMKPLDLFLHTHTLDQDFYHEQINLNDSQERVLLYTRVLAMICRLELTGFHKELLKSVAQNEHLLENFRLLVSKLFTKRFSSMWCPKMEEFLLDMELLLLQSYQAGILEENGLKLLEDIPAIIDKSDNEMAKKKATCLQLMENLKQIVKCNKVPEEAHQQQTAGNEVTKPLEIYPTLEELNSSSSSNDSDDDDDKDKDIANSEALGNENIQSYLNYQLKNLRQHFVDSLRLCVRMIKENPTAKSFPDAFQFYDDVFIVLNEDFLGAYLYELIFVDVLGTQRKDDTDEVQISYQKQEQLKRIKCGALLCFTTSRSFEDLVMARVTYTNSVCLREGFVGIEIVRQYNIGNIYNRKLLMWESPDFFEPYHNVFNYLRDCSFTSFPMKRYILNADTTSDIQIPKYLKPDTVYKCGDKTFKPLTDEPPKEVTLNLNESQMEAYGRALKREFALIQGPPGTGKTHLSVQLVKTLIENAETPIILITYTNESLDKFLLKLAPYTDNIVRFGSQSRNPEISKYKIKEVVDHSLINPKLKRLYYLVNLEFKDKFQMLQQQHKDFDGTDDAYQRILQAQNDLAQVSSKLQTLKIMFQCYVAKDKSIVAMTTTFAAKTNYMFRLLKSKIVIFEEAAEILESHVLACLTPYTQHVIMLGDHQQLHPYTTTNKLKQTAPRKNVSLFERLYRKQTDKALILKTQYRMHPRISDLLTPTIYKELQNAESVYNYPAVRNMSSNLYFLNHNQKESKSDYESSLFNNFEIEEVSRLTLHLIQKAGYEPEDVQILSPYAKQIDLIRKQLQKYDDLLNIKACTVDSFQGLEANIIILSLVRCNTIPQIGFLMDPNRICVALSRAKHGLYIIGNLDLLASCCKTWMKIQRKLANQNAIGLKFPIEM